MHTFVLTLDVVPRIGASTTYWHWLMLTSTNSALTSKTPDYNFTLARIFFDFVKYVYVYVYIYIYMYMYMYMYIYVCMNE